jgi:4-O-beta-D-mannosyl-D-glucose phosphorylase
MEPQSFELRLAALKEQYRTLIALKNEKLSLGNGIYDRYRYPVLTREHTPLFWRYDLNDQTNPYLMERMGINSVWNPGAVELGGKIHLMARVEGADRKSFFAVAESETGIDGFTFWDDPVVMPETVEPDINVYNMRVVQHEDGWIYGLFCIERKDPDGPEGDTSDGVAACGIVRTKDLKTWQRLPDLQTISSQQRDVVLHPEFINGKYALYTRLQDGIIEAGKGRGIGWSYTDSMEHAQIDQEMIIDAKEYHTIKEVKTDRDPPRLKPPGAGCILPME